MQPDNSVDFLKLLPPGASVTAVIVVVFVFLKFIKEMQAEHKTTIKEMQQEQKTTIKELTDNYNVENRETRSYFSAQIKDIGDRFSKAIDTIQAELRRFAENRKD